MANRLSIQQLIDWIESGQIRGLARAISIVENDLDGKDALLKFAFKMGWNSSLSLGFTGAPGAGKSTIINELIKKYRTLDRSVGVIAIDPTSPFSGGAFLGDRVRMREHAADPGIFIRSMASRGALGGLSEATKQVLYLYKAFKFDVIIIETVGVGQDEIDIVNYADITAVLLAPGLGDSIQMSKAGIMEIADLFVLNKSDRPDAEVTRKQLENTLAILPDDRRPPIVSTVADKGVGIDEMMAAIETVRHRINETYPGKIRDRLAEEIRSTVVYHVNKEIRTLVEAMTERVLQEEITPVEAASEILNRYTGRQRSKKIVK